MKHMLFLGLIIILILAIRYMILVSYIPAEVTPPPKDGTLCPEIFNLYSTAPYIEVPNKNYDMLPPTVSQTVHGIYVSLSVRNDGNVDYRVNGQSIWTSDDTVVRWSEDLKNVNLMMSTNESLEVTSISKEFCLQLIPLSIYKRTNGEHKKKIWDLEGWDETYRPTEEHPTGHVFLISDNRHMQLSLLSNGDLVVVEKTSLSIPPKVKMSLLKTFCEY